MFYASLERAAPASVQSMGVFVRWLGHTVLTPADASSPATRGANAVLYGYAPRDTWAPGAAPDNSDPNLALVRALGRWGVVVPFFFEGAMGGDAFAQGLRRPLERHLRPGYVVVDGHGAPSPRGQSGGRSTRCDARAAAAYSPDVMLVEEGGGPAAERAE
jgi:hypothetical protein